MGYSRVTAEQAATSPIAFAVYCTQDMPRRYQAPPHVRMMQNVLVPSIWAGDGRHTVEMPPRHGKSWFVSMYLPAWFLGSFPDKRCMLASYGDTFAARWGGRVRDLLEQHGPAVFAVRPDRSRSARDSWDLESWVVGDNGVGRWQGRLGGMDTAGIGGVFTGKGADLLIVDDPTKNAKDAMSEVLRDAAWEWFASTALTRLEPAATAIVMATRWHEDDLIGRLTRPVDAEAADELGDDAPNPDEWRVLKLPALAGRDDALGREEGEPLWPSRYDAERLGRIRKRIGSYWWSALFQQTPTPSEGSIFKRSDVRYYDVLPRNDWRLAPPGGSPPQPDECIATWDMNFKDADDADYVVGQVWERYAADCYLVAQLRGRMTFNECKRGVVKLAQHESRPTVQLIEKAANGYAIIQELRSVVPGVVGVDVRESKLARAYSVSPMFEAGNVHLPEPHLQPWVGELVEEAIGFPRGANDDQVDAMTQGLNRLRWVAVGSVDESLWQ